MTSRVDGTSSRAVGRSDLLTELLERLKAIEALADTLGDGLRQGDEASIEAATARLETLLVEYRVLAQEVQRSAGADDAANSTVEDRRVLSALEATATRVARSGAIAAGIVGRMAVVNRRLCETLRGDLGSTYRSDGHSLDGEIRGVRLRERA